MNKNTKLLPQLTSLFLQRQSYNSHKKKILQIRKKKPKPTIRYQLSCIHSRKSSQNTSLKDSKIGMNSNTPKTQLNSLPPTILQRSHSLRNSLDWMSPFRRQRQQHMQRENERMKSKIKLAKSDVKSSKLMKQYDKFAKIKQRLMKYQTNPQSHKSMLKSQKILNLMEPTSRVSECSSKSIKVHQSNKESYLFTDLQRRKQSNFSSFVKKTDELKQKSVRNKIINFQQKLRPVINYTQMQRNIGKYNRKLKTEASNKTIKLSNSRQKNQSRYFALTEIDI